MPSYYFVLCKAYYQGVQQGAGKPSISHIGESMEEDDMVISRVIPQYRERERDEPMGEEGGCKPEELIRGSQGLAEGQPWQPLRASGMQLSKGPKVPLHSVPLDILKSTLLKLYKLFNIHTIIYREFQYKGGNQYYCHYRQLLIFAILFGGLYNHLNRGHVMFLWVLSWQNLAEFGSILRIQSSFIA